MVKINANNKVISRKNMKKSKWIWYYGDFEIFHSAKLHSLRQEQGTTFPGFWSLANVYPIVRFSKTVMV